MQLKLTSIEFSSGLSGRLFWIILSRLIIYGFLFAAFLIFLPAQGAFYYMLIAYGSLAIGFLLYVMAFNRRPNERLIKLIIGLQILFEFIFEAILVNRVGGNLSPLLLLFILSIVSATMVYGLVGTLIAATVAGLCYAAPIMSDLSRVLPKIFEPSHIKMMGLSTDEAFYTVFLHLCLFYIIAFISGYMAENLLFTSRELHQVRLETDEILENMHSGMITVDNLGKVVYFNRAAGDILGLSSIQVKGRHYKDILSEVFPELYYKIELALSAGYVESRGEVEINASGAKIPIGISTSILKSDVNGIRGVIVVFQNLREVKLMEKRLRDADRLATIGQLSAGIAHEIRNPLASISGSVEVLSESLSPTDEQDKKLLELILKESSRLNTILTEFLSFARITGSPQTKTDLVPLIKDIILLTRTHADFHEGISVKFDHPDHALFARGDQDHHKQLLWNLLINAAQALGSKGGNIFISCGLHVEARGKVWTLLKIRDTGPGIQPNIRDMIFKPFYSTKTDGTGLGLAIVSRIVDSFDGRIDFDTDDTGTEFSIFLPPDADNPLFTKSIPKHINV